MIDNLAALPATARDLVEQLGARLALKIIQRWPGIKFRVPLGVRENAPMRERLVEALGEADADRLAVVFGGETIYVPICAQAVRDLRDLRIIDDYSHGASVTELSLRECLSARQIENILKRTPGMPRAARRRAAGGDKDQMDLFDS